MTGDFSNGINPLRLIFSSFLLSSLIFILSAYITRFQDLHFLSSHFSIFPVVLLLVLQELLFRGIIRKLTGNYVSALLFAVLVPIIYFTSYLNYAVLALVFFISALFMNYIVETEGILASIIGEELLLFYYFSTISNPFFATIVLSILLISFSFYWYLRKGAGFSHALYELGLKKENLLKDILFGIGMTFIIFFTVLLVGVLLSLLGSNDSQLVRERVDTFPGYILAFAVLIAPIGEEIFFRGFLASRIGMPLSSLAFAFAHAQYGSISEIIITFLIGMIFAYSLKYTKSLAPAIVSHCLFNLISIALMRLS